MSVPEWTPEFKASCIAVAHAARTEPETVDGLRAQLEAMAALCRETAAAQESERAAADALVAGLRKLLSRAEERALVAEQMRSTAAEEQVQALGEALRDCAVLLGWQEHAQGPGWQPLPLPLKRRVLALLTSLPAAAGLRAGGG